MGRFTNPRKLAVVPAYNEAESVGTVVRKLQTHAPSYDILVVDDGSTDATPRIAEEAGARVLRLPFNLGIGGAVQSGFRFALDNGYQYVVQVDGDGQHDPREIRRLEEAMARDRVDMVCGSRFLTKDHKYPAPISRRTGIHLFAFLLSRFVGQRVSDPTSGFRLYNRRGISVFANDYPHDYPEVEATVMVFRHRLRLEEVPVSMRERGGGQSSITALRSIYYMVKVLLAIFVGVFRRNVVLVEER